MDLVEWCPDIHFEPLESGQNIVHDFVTCGYL